jgi:hypothetical protein
MFLHRGDTCEYRRFLGDMLQGRVARPFEFFSQDDYVVVVRVVLMLPAAYPRQEADSSAATIPCQNTVLRPENF